MIWQQLTIEEMNEAFEMSKALPEKMNGNYSGNDPLKRLSGYIGQVAAHKFLKGSTNVDGFEFDLIFNDLKVEVKTTCRSVPPRPHYVARVACSNSSQFCDLYLFGSAQCENGKFMHGCWLVGWITKPEMLERMWFEEKGKEHGDGFVEKGDCFKILIEDLNPIKDLIESSK